jgi:hypothetical protein
MDWMKQLGGVLDRYADRGAVRPPDEAVHEDFDQFVRAAPPDAVADGLSAAFRSEHTPPFPLMASQLFGRAGGPAMPTSSPCFSTGGRWWSSRSSPGASAAPRLRPGRRAGRIPAAGGAPPVTHRSADQLDYGTSRTSRGRRRRGDPSVIDRISQVYAEQPPLVEDAGGAWPSRLGAWREAARARDPSGSGRERFMDVAERAHAPALALTS